MFLSPTFPSIPALARRFAATATALGLTLGATAVSADPTCGRNAIPRDTVWFLTFTSVSPFVCELTFTNQRGNYTGVCVVYSSPSPGDFTVSGRVSVNNQCAFNGTLAVDGPDGSEITMIGQLWSADLGDANGPDAGSGMFFANDGFSVNFAPLQLVRRSFDHGFPRLSEFLSSGN